MNIVSLYNIYIYIIYAGKTYFSSIIWDMNWREGYIILLLLDIINLIYFIIVNNNKIILLYELFL